MKFAAFKAYGFAEPIVVRVDNIAVLTRQRTDGQDVIVAHMTASVEPLVLVGTMEQVLQTMANASELRHMVGLGR